MSPDWYSNSLTTWAHVLDEKAVLYDSKVFLSMNGETVTFGDFHRRVERLAQGLIAIGIKKGEVVALYLINSIDWVICQFAIYKIGAILLPLYSYYRKKELTYALSQAEVVVLIMQDDFLGQVNALSIVESVIPELKNKSSDTFESVNFPYLRHIIRTGGGDNLIIRHDIDDITLLGSEILPKELERRQDSISPFDVMNIMYTSGTTGFPKGGMSMHVTNLVTTHQWSEIAQLGSDDVILCHVPLFTNFGGLYGAPLGLRNGSKVIITEKFDAAQSLRLIEKEGVTYIPGTPSMFRMMLDHPNITKTDLSSLKSGHVAGAPLNNTTMREIIEVLGVSQIMQAWGLSECGGLSTVSTANHPNEKRLTTVGKPLNSVNLYIKNNNEGMQVTSGVQGEILLGDVRPGSCVGKGYWKMPEKTHETIDKNGFFHTGDVGFIDEDGYLHVTGRVDDMFTVGGFNIFPAEIEMWLQEIKEVREAYIVPINDHYMGNVPVAWIVSDPGSSLTKEMISDHVRLSMTSQKVPRRVYFCTSDDLPRTPIGKVKKKDLADMTKRKIEKLPDSGLISREMAK